MAGRLGYCQQDRTRQVLRGDELRDCWVAEVDDAPPMLGLFGSLDVVPAPTPQPVQPRPPAPTAAVAAQRRWDAIVAGGTHEESTTRGRGGAIATAMPVTSAATAADPATGTTTATRGLPAWLEPGRISIKVARPAAVTPAARVTPAGKVAPTRDATTDAEAVIAPTTFVALPLGPLAQVHTAPAPSVPALAPVPVFAPPPAVLARAIPVRAWNAEAPAGATPMPAATTASAMDSVVRWRHAARADPPAPPPVVDEPPARRVAAFSLLPATLTNRFRRRLGTRGLRGQPDDPGMAAVTVPAPTPAPRPAPFARTRSAGSGGLVEAPIVPGTIQTLGDQLRRAEQIRRERALLDLEALRGDRGDGPRP